MTAVRGIDTSAYCKLHLSDFRFDHRIRNHLVGHFCLAFPYEMQSQTSNDDLLLIGGFIPRPVLPISSPERGCPARESRTAFRILAELLMAAINLPPRATSHFSVSLITRDAPKPDNGYAIQHNFPLECHQ
jgi:hypothetical protein